MNRESLVYNLGESGWMLKHEENTLSAVLTKIVSSRITKTRGSLGRIYILKEYQISTCGDKWFEESFLRSIFFITKEQVKAAVANRVIFTD